MKVRLKSHSFNPCFECRIEQLALSARHELILKPLLLPNVAGVALEFEFQVALRERRDKAAKNAAKKVKRAKPRASGQALFSVVYPGKEDAIQRRQESC